jgi:non-canonical (house-cleaning) NTP pyrophosphatase
MSESPYNQQPSQAELELAAIQRLRSIQPQVEAKITIFIEAGNKIRKIEIPQASHVEIDTEHNRYNDGTVGFQLNCKALYDIDRGSSITYEYGTVAEERLVGREFLHGKE